MPAADPDLPAADPELPAPGDPEPDVTAIRRRLLTDGLGIGLSVAAFAFVYGLAARETGLSLIEALAMSALVFAGAAQFAALGLLDQACRGWASSS